MIKMYKRADLVVISLWTMISVFSVIFSEFEFIGYIKVLLGIPLVFFIPGYLLITALFPKKESLNVIDRIVLSIGTSIATIILLGSLLSFTFGITSISIITILCLYTMIFIVIIAYRRHKLPEDVIFFVEFDNDNIINFLKPKSNIDLMLNIIIIVVMILAVVVSYNTIMTPKIGEKFTEFYILDSSGKDNYPTIINSSIVVLIGVTNHEYAPVNYTVQTVLDKNILTSEKLILKNHDTWEKNITLSPILQQNRENVELEFLLFKEDNMTTPYRSLHLWVS